MNRIECKFKELERQGRAALMPYLPLGYPTPAVSQSLILRAEAAGADIIELGLPFSDPLADGPVIQHAAQVALENGMTMSRCLDMARAARREGVGVPLVLMGYYNPILRFGVGRWAREACAAGADGLIVPDLPPEEAGELSEACRTNGLDLVFLAAPTSTDERLKMIAAATSGFLYMVSLAGVTGARDSLPAGLEDFLVRARAATAKPLCVGFGIGSAESARRVAQVADGAIVGSALVSRIADPEKAPASASEFIGELRKAVDTPHLGRSVT